MSDFSNSNMDTTNTFNNINKQIDATVSGVPRNFVRGEGGVQQIQLRTEDRENGDLGAVAA